MALRSMKLGRPLLRRALSGSNVRALSSSDATLTEVPDKCEVLVVGGGIIGVSVAYHLAQRGVNDVVLLERHKLTSGTTWHAAGLVGQMRATKVETELSAAAADVYEALKLETGLDTGYKQCGSLTTAATRERLEFLKRNSARARSYGLEAEVLTPDECGALMTHDGHTIIKTDDLHGGLWLPGDGSGSPTASRSVLFRANLAGKRNPTSSNLAGKRNPTPSNLAGRRRTSRWPSPRARACAASTSARASPSTSSSSRPSTRAASASSECRWKTGDGCRRRRSCSAAASGRATSRARPA